MKYISDITGLIYSDDEVLRIRNMDQAARFIEHGAKVYDIVISKRDRKLAIVFNKEDVAPLKALWDRWELK